MEIWQHLLVLIISGSALFLGGAIAKYTASEIKYAQKWLILFNQLCALALIVIVLFVLSVAWYWYVLVLVLFLGYIYKKSQSKKMQSLKHQKRTLLNYAFYTLFGIFYGVIASSSFVLLFSTIVFLDGLVIGSFNEVRNKDVWEYVIPCVLYFLVGLASIWLSSRLF